MANRAELEAKIADDLSRGDLTNQITDAVDAAIRAYRYERFTFNEVYRVTATLSVSADSISLDTISVRFRKFDRVRLHRSTNDDIELFARDPDWIKGRQDIRVLSMPLEYAVYGNALQFDSMADQTYTLYLDGIKDIANTVDPDEAIWSTDAFELIRQAAKKDVYMNTLKDYEKAAVAEKAERKAYNDLKAEYESQNSTGFIRPTTF